MKLEVSQWMEVKPVAMDWEMNRLVRLAAVLAIRLRNLLVLRIWKRESTF
ncbi:hypothetical protein [Peribacillus aracenensis]|nr:hypothetical protein [Peribacillus sp. BBB004]